MARFLLNFRPTRAFYGPILGELAHLDLPIPIDDLPTCCIAGGLSYRCGFLPFFGEDNDGVVSVREALMPDSAENHLIPVPHALLPFSKRAVELTAAFLASG